jgi:hypothetical protein
MKRFFKLNLPLVAMLSVALSALAQIEPNIDAASPAAATVLSVAGGPKMSVDGGKKFKKLKFGQTIPVGAIVRTGTGKLSMLMSEGTVVHLGSQSEITLKEHDPSQAGGGTLFGLATGFARFVVAKLQPGKHFEVRTANAVAAVKGTDFETGLAPDGHTIVKVFESVTKGSVEMSGLDKLKSVLLGENMQGNTDGTEIKTGPLDAKDVKEMLERYDKLNPPAPSQGDGKSDEKKDEEAGTAETRELTQADEIANAVIADTLERFMEQYDKDQAFDQGVRNSDINEFRVVIDHTKVLTLVSQATYRIDGDTTLYNSTGSYRSSGANMGTSYAIELTHWNHPLPDNWPSIVYRPLNDPTNLDASGMPFYFRLSETFTAGNPFGDTLDIVTDWHTPNFCAPCGNIYQQGYRQEYFLNNTSQAYMDISAPDNISGLDFNCTKCPSLSMLASAEQANGGYSFEYMIFGSEIFTQHLTLHDDDGLIQQTWNSGFTHPNDYRDSAFDGLNTSVVFTSPYFTNAIDLVFMPGYFKTFDGPQLPLNYFVGGGL